RLDDLRAEQRLLRIPRQLEEAAPAREDAAALVADDHSRARSRVVVLHQLEQEAESAAGACDRLVEQALLAVVVDRPLLAVRADEVGHMAIVAMARFGA